MVVCSIVVRLIVHSMTFLMTKNQKSFQALIVKIIRVRKVKVQCHPKYLQNVKKMAIHQGRLLQLTQGSTQWY